MNDRKEGAVRLAIVGAGSRGLGYARRAVKNGAVVTAVVEPDRERLDALLAALPGHPIREFATWDDLAAEKAADAAIIATPDRLHVDPAVALAAAGYHLLVEKPLAPTEAEALRIVDAVEAAGVMLAVCHVMRYSDYTARLKEVIDSGAIGQIASVEHLEPIGWWHFAHSYVRGNWRRESESSSMLMAKSCHDIDWLSYIVDRPVEKVSSFGGLMHFRPENKPANAGDRCVDCPLQQTCAYSATKIYRGFLESGGWEQWPLAVLDSDVSAESINRALEVGPYGECVYNGQNDVADHQVVNLQYAGGVTASFTVTAFTDLAFRKTRVFGTGGWIEGDGRMLHVQEFATGRKYSIDSAAVGGASAADGHGGADDGLVDAFLRAVATGDESHLLSGPQQSLETHRVVWLAEESRRTEGTVVRDIPGGPLKPAVL
ncbi:oxidoreductase [Kocuria polaris]|nr:oxidoreductase [Kocuria polaris]